MSKRCSLICFMTAPVMICALVWLAFPYLQFYIDPDATSYLTLVRHYLDGRYHEAINGFWSPMGCWLTVLLVKASDMELFAAAITVNTAAACGTVICSQALFFRLRKDCFERIGFTVVSALFWSYAVYKQSFTDLWQYLFIMSGILLLLMPRFTRRPWLWIATGIIAALAYYGKAYSFFFFPLMALAAVRIKLKQEGHFTLQKWLGITAVTVSVMAACAAPWIYLLYNKYGIWTSSTAGTLNLSWWLTGHPEYRPDIKVLLPPPYPGSVFSFEDPYLLQGHFEHFWDSPRLLVRQMVRIGYNAINWIGSCNTLSPFYFITWLSTVIILFSNKRRTIFPTPEWSITAWVFLLYPLAFWLMTFDNGRYLWITIPLSMALFPAFADRILTGCDRRVKNIVISLFFLSYLASAVPDIKNMYRTGEEEYKIAAALRRAGVHGSFTTNYAISGQIGQYILRIAYFSQCPLYCYGENKWTEEEILADAARYGVRYYFYFYEGASSAYQLKNAGGNPFPEITGTGIKGLKVFKLEDNPDQK